MDLTSVPRNQPSGGGTTGAALILRSLALFAVLYQFRLIAKDMADTPVFVAALCAAFAAAAFLPLRRGDGKKNGPLAALLIIGLIPWVTRAFIALPRFFFPARADMFTAALDSLILNLDRNNFVSLFPFYWASGTSWFAIRSRKFLRAAVIADAVVLLVLFSIVRTADIEMYRWPVVMIVFFAGIVFLQALALLFSLPPETRLRTTEAAAAVAALLILIAAGGLIFLKPLREQAVEKGGGLLEPKLFSFDFSQFLRLDSEISMKDDLILIVRKDGDDDHILLRRSVLSGYSRKQGFYRIEELDERTHPQRLPDRPLVLAGRTARGQAETPGGASAVKAVRPLNQEYFLVNFDAAAFIGMNDPAAVIPYESWDASSFSSAYAVESKVSEAGFAELSRAALAWPGAAELGLDADEFGVYTDYGGDERIRAYAEEITRGLERYGDKVRMIHNWLKYGEYRYSLKPGIAPDGDQLGWFLFQSKKGYCSYYAFSMALLLRSLGIPARVAAGFFIDLNTNTFNYYPVRSDMAHAWVEVPYPGYGWIEYDPTSENLAEGEEFRFSGGTDAELFERLMREILENRSRLRARDKPDQAAGSSNAGSLARSAAALLRDHVAPVLLLLYAAFCVYIRCGFLFAAQLRRDKRGRAVCLWRHANRRLSLAGLVRPPSVSESEWALENEKRITGIYALYQGAAAARFAPVFSDSQFSAYCRSYQAFSAAYGRHVPFRRRLLAWFLPPLALVLKARGFAPLLMVLLLIVPAGPELAAQYNDEQVFSAADELYMDATEAEFAEFWERAIALFREGNARYPDDPRFPWSLGNLYYSRSLYGLAWDEYLKAEMISPFDTDILLRLAGTAGYLNRDETSVEYYERILTIDPDNKEAIGSLGWMYYKVHRLGEGERLLSAALERFGDDPDFSMTLGTIYSDMYRYDQGRYWYQKAIAGGEAQGDRHFTAVAWYNLSILESRFYRFDLAMDATNASLNAQNRASGRLARGELYLRRLDLEEAQKDYGTAYETDTSPLAKLNLAQVYQISGRLEEARLYAEDCLKGGDLSWMLHYGIDPDRYKRDIHDILYKTYQGLAREERFMPWGRAGEKIRSFFRYISFGFKAEVHRKLYQKYSLASADAYGKGTGGGPPPGSQPGGGSREGSPLEPQPSGGSREGSPLELFTQYYNAFETYPRRARAYLTRARDFESSLIPAAESSYVLEEGVLLGDAELLEQALAALDPVWQREMIARCYRELFRHGKGGGAAARQAAEELFVLNRGALRQAGIALPVEIRLDPLGEINGPAFRRSEKKLRGALSKAGFKPAAGAPASPARFSLRVSAGGAVASGYSLTCELIDASGAVKPRRHTIPLRSLSRADIADFARTLGNAVFRVE